MVSLFLDLTTLRFFARESGLVAWFTDDTLRLALPFLTFLSLGDGILSGIAETHLRICFLDEIRFGPVRSRFSLGCGY